MNRFFLLFFLLLPALAQATFCVDYTYETAHVKLELCQNHSGFRETRTLLYKGRVLALERYVAALPSLKNKKIVIGIEDAALTYAHLLIRRGKTSDTISVSGYPDLQLLAGYVHYLAGKTAAPVSFGFETTGTNDGRIADFNKKLTAPGLERVQDTTDTVWEMNDLRIAYRHDSTFFLLGNWPMSFHPVADMPFRVEGKWLFVQQDSVFLYENQTRSASFFIPVPGRQEEDYGVSYREGRVDYCRGGCPVHERRKTLENVVFYYRPDDNKFYIVP